MPGVDRISRFDDFQVIRFVQSFGEQILAGCDVAPDVLEDGLHSQLRKDARVGALLGMTPADANRKLDIAEAAPAARAMLALWSADPAIAPALKKALKEWRDDDLATDLIMSVGYVVSLWICVASVGFKGTIGYSARRETSRSSRKAQGAHRTFRDADQPTKGRATPTGIRLTVFRTASYDALDCFRY